MITHISCRRVARRLWQYAAGELPLQEQQRIATHLNRCAHCRRELGEYRTVLDLLSARSREAIPASQATWRDLKSRLTPAQRLAPHWRVLQWSGTALILWIVALTAMKQERYPRFLADIPPDVSSETYIVALGKTHGGLESSPAHSASRKRNNSSERESNRDVRLIRLQAPLPHRSQTRHLYARRRKSSLPYVSVAVQKPIPKPDVRTRTDLHTQMGDLAEPALLSASFAPINYVLDPVTSDDAEAPDRYVIDTSPTPDPADGESDTGDTLEHRIW